MREYLLLGLLAMSLVPGAAARASLKSQTRRPIPGRTRNTANPEIQRVVAEISSARIESNIKSLVGFYTRNTLSDTESDSRGIGAARRWIKQEFERYSRDSGGKLQVEFDQFTQPPGRRNPKPVEVVN